jgi:hypothetical protein
MSWRDSANEVLATLFIIGQPAPTKQQLFDAYPFGMRKYTPYKVWLEQVREWKKAWAKGLSHPDARRQVAKSRAERANADASTGRLL